MKKLEKPVYSRTFFGTIAIWTMDIVLLIAYILGFGTTPEAFEVVMVISGVVGGVVAFIADDKLNPKPYNRDDNYDRYFSLLCVISAIISICLIVLYVVRLWDSAV